MQQNLATRIIISYTSRSTTTRMLMKNIKIELKTLYLAYFISAIIWVCGVLQMEQSLTFSTHHYMLLKDHLWRQNTGLRVSTTALSIHLHVYLLGSILE